jgi:ElaA protein
MNIEWRFKKFDALSAMEIYDILSLRNRVFVVEQNCVYLDTDGMDPSAWHLAGYRDEILVSYARIIPPGIVYKEASIGRVVTDPGHRKQGSGRLLMEKAMDILYKEFAVPCIKIGAQLYLEKFYSSLGFSKISSVYMEDGIPHIHMLHTK